MVEPGRDRRRRDQRSGRDADYQQVLAPRRQQVAAPVTISINAKEHACIARRPELRGRAAVMRVGDAEDEHFREGEQQAAGNTGNAEQHQRDAQITSERFVFILC